MGCGVSKSAVEPLLAADNNDDVEDSRSRLLTGLSDDCGNSTSSTREEEGQVDSVDKARRNGKKLNAPQSNKRTSDNIVNGVMSGEASLEVTKENQNPNQEGQLDLQKQKPVENQNASRINVKHSVTETDLKLLVFLQQAEKVIGEINSMSLTLDDIPGSYKKVKTLRELYHKARYDYGEEFCKTFLTSLLEMDLIPCIRDGFRKIQEEYPQIFNEPSDESFKAFPYPKLNMEDYNPPEAAVGCVWIKLNSTVLGITDLHELSRMKAGEQGLLEYYLTELLPAVSEGTPPPKTVRGKILENSMAAIYNCSLSPSTFRFFEKYQGVELLLPLLNTPNEKLNMNALFAVSYLIDEKNNELIMSNNDTIDKIISYLKNAIKFKKKRYKGMSSIELAKALKQIAVNDHNKKLIGSREGLTTLLNMLNTAQTDEERIAASKAMWMLLFDEDNKKLFKEAEEAVKQIKAYSESENKQIRKVVAGILWELQTKYEQTERAMSLSDLQQDEREISQHLMISYQWDEQPTMLKIRDCLKKEGYKVWMDVDKIGGSTLQAMAVGVENAAVVLMGVSRKYKKSTNCRSEAEYAFQLKKDIIPVMLEPQYQPDGWLGIVVGAKFWVDFSQRPKVNENISKLIKEIGERGRAGNEIVKAIDEIDSTATKKTRNREEVMKWTVRQVKRWMGDQGLHETSIKKTILDRLTGKRLILLRELHEKSPDFFYNSLRADFGFSDVLSLLDFTEALKNLFGEN